MRGPVPPRSPHTTGLPEDRSWGSQARGLSGTQAPRQGQQGLTPAQEPLSPEGLSDLLLHPGEEGPWQPCPRLLSDREGRGGGGRPGVNAGPALLPRKVTGRPVSSPLLPATGSQKGPPGRPGLSRQEAHRLEAAVQRRLLLSGYSHLSHWGPQQSWKSRLRHGAVGLGAGADTLCEGPRDSGWGADTPCEGRATRDGGLTPHVRGHVTQGEGLTPRVRGYDSG